MKRRFLSALLALCLMLSLMPTAWASGGTADPPVSGNCGTNVQWILSGATLTIYTPSGTGTMAAPTPSWDASKDKITAVEILSGVTNIHDGAFSGLPNLTSITIPNSVTTVGNSPLVGCSALKNIYFSGTNEQWDAIKAAVLENVTTSPVVDISNETPSNSGTCGEGVYWNLSDDGTLNIYGNGPIVIEGVAPWAANRDKIKNIIISDGVTAIGGGAFVACPNLVDVVIPVSVKEIGSGAFAGIKSTVKVHYSGTETEWDAIGGSGRDDIASAKIQVDYRYVPIVLTFAAGKAEGDAFQLNTVAGRTFRLPKKEDALTHFVPPTYLDGTVDKKMEFRGWLIGDMLYPPDYPFQVESDTTFTAWWDRESTGTNQVTFRHKYNDGTQSYDEGDTPVDFFVSERAQTLRIGAPSKPGYTFIGWTSPTDREPKQSVIVPANGSGTLIYTVNWQGNTHHIQVIGSNGQEFSAAEYVVSPEPQTIKLTVPTADGRTWTITTTPPTGGEINNATADTPGEASIKLPEDYYSDIVLEGTWTNNDYTLIWDANGGNWGQDADGKDIPTLNQVYKFNPDADLTVSVPAETLISPIGYEFDGWETEEGVTYDAENKQINIKAGTFGDLTISAKWKESVYTVTWDANGGYWSKAEDGTEDTEDKTSEYTIKDKTLTREAPKRDGYVFRGWKCAKSDGAEVDIIQPEGDYNTVNLPEKPEDYLGDLTLTAIWVEEHTVTLEPNNAVEGKDPQEPLTFPVVDGEKYTLPTIEETKFTPPDPSKQFAGWRLEGDTDPDKLYQPGEEYEVKANTTFKAEWGDITYDVIVVDGGEKTVTEKVIHGADYELKPFDHPDYGFTAPAGKAFDYWLVDAFPGRKFNPGDKLRQVQQDYKVTAVWKDVLYTVTFEKDNENAEGTMAPVTGLTYGTEYALPECGFTYPAPVPDPDDPDAPLTKYVFLAWDVDGTEYAPGAVITITKDTIVKAVWEDEANLDTYTVTYAPGGGTGEMKPDTFRVRKGASASITVPLPGECGFTFTDMTFAGWIVGGEKYAPGEAVSISSSVQATARWQGKIVYVDGGGVTKPDSYEYTPEAYEPLTIEGTPVKPGSIFTEWTCDDESVAIFNNSLIDLPAGFSGTLTLTGHWVEDEGKYLITFDPNGGTGTMDPVTVDKPGEGEPAPEHELPPCGFEPPEGMEFDCWLVGETKFQPGEPIPVTGHTTVIAQWKKKDVDPDAEDCVVTYLPGEGTGEAIVEEGHKVGEWLKLPECTFTAPEDMEFDAWQKGEQKAAPGEEVYLDSEAVTITALWKEKEPEPDDPTKPWTITFDANGGTGAMDPVTVPKAEGGTTYTLPACGFTAPEGKTFQAWKFDGKEYAPGAVITITGDTTITAVWKDAEVKPPKPTSWKITYNLNGGYMTGSGPTSYNLSDQAQTLNVPVPYKSGFTFLGWTYSGVSKPTKSVVIRANMTGDLTVVANWQMNPGAGGGNNTSQGYYISVSATAGGEIIIPWEYANQGAVVSVQARPQPGYEVGGVTVVNSQGFEVGDLKDLGGGNYSFTMPGYRVNVSATFKLQSAAAGPITRPVMNYEDVRLGDWFYDSVEYVYTRGMMSGVSATQFGPYGQATRGAIWTALAAHAGFDINGGATWYERGQYWAVNRGITDGESPSGTITREQLVTMLWRYKGSPVVFGGDLWQFTDGYAVSSYAMDAMRWAVSTGLIGGANGRLSPQASTTRAEAAAILARFCQS